MKSGDRRIVRKFLWYPRFFNVNNRFSLHWLKTAEIVEESEVWMRLPESYGDGIFDNPTYYMEWVEVSIIP